MESSRVESSLISGGSIWKDESKTYEAPLRGLRVHDGPGLCRHVGSPGPVPTLETANYCRQYGALVLG